jgi:Ca-activated chloride channel family protein
VTTTVAAVGFVSASALAQAGLPGLDWARPVLLWGLAAVPLAVLVIWLLARRRRSALEAFAQADVRARTQPLPRRARGMRAALLVAGLAALVVAAAGPRWGVVPTTLPPVDQRIVFALDVSYSMLARDVEPSRLDRARLAIRQIAAALPAAEVGLVAFAGEGALAVPLTRDVGAIDLYLASVGPDWISDPSTDIGNAVRVALDAFGPAPGPGRAVVVVSDGENQAGNVQAAADAARRAGVEVEGLGVGTRQGAPIPLGEGYLAAGGETVITRLEPQLLAALAEATGGVYATDVAPIVARLGALERAQGERLGATERADRYRWPLGIALLCLALEAWLRFAGRGARLPATGAEGSAPRASPAAGRPLRPAAAILALAFLAMGRADSPYELYEDGRYREALLAWRSADRRADATPEDAYNRGNAAYRLGEFREAAASYAVAARTAGARSRVAAAWYNAGNARYRLAQQAERSGLPRAPSYWEAAVSAYREALLRDPDDREAKHNLELALRRRETGGGGGGAGGGGGGGGGGAGGGGRGVQPPSSDPGRAPPTMSRAEAERLLDALAAREREALAAGDDDRRAGRPATPGW